jgi:hypothetical protein
MPMRLQTRRPCRKGEAHKLKRTKTNYNIDNLECVKCADAMPVYLSKEKVIERLGEKTFTCSEKHNGKCADNLQPLIQRQKPVWVVKCRQCGEQIDEENFV